jgi:hypothetical protein
LLPYISPAFTEEKQYIERMKERKKKKEGKTLLFVAYCIQYVDCG